MTNPTAKDYGDKYWCIIVDPSLVSKGATPEIFVFADEFVVVEGSLRFVRMKNQSYEPVLSIAPGLWKCVYAASVIDGHAVAVEHWAGQINES